MKMPKITILWGETPEDGQKAKTYTFKTKAELEAFKFGVSEMNGWYDWEEVEEGYVFKYDQYYRREGT
tara:strand:+ start:585 stop:788 length:204 start_codon:yes stop_codon:yes gene_type:complete